MDLQKVWLEEITDRIRWNPKMEESPEEIFEGLLGWNFWGRRKFMENPSDKILKGTEGTTAIVWWRSWSNPQMTFSEEISQRNLLNNPQKEFL